PPRDDTNTGKNHKRWGKDALAKKPHPSCAPMVLKLEQKKCLTNLQKHDDYFTRFRRLDSMFGPLARPKVSQVEYHAGQSVNPRVSAKSAVICFLVGFVAPFGRAGKSEVLKSGPEN
ncbi:MAG TPA: hypothetical protein VKU82_11765, partial [Planctomycetaceae bacterium]|nr:hypothetical protein [Planctomycetaceae bacterium]